MLKRNYRNRNKYSFDTEDDNGIKRKSEIKIDFFLTEEEKEILLVAIGQVPHPKIKNAFPNYTSSISVRDFIIEAALREAREILKGMSAEEINTAKNVPGFPRRKREPIVFDIVVEEEAVEQKEREPVVFEMVVEN